MPNPYTLYFNHSWLQADQINHEFMDETMYFAQGVSQEIRSYEYHGSTYIFKATEHYHQLRNQAKTKGLELAISCDRFIQLMYDLLEKNHLTNASINALAYEKDGKSKFLLTAKKAPRFEVRENLSVSTTSPLTERLATSPTGTITFSSTKAFFMIKDGVLYTPSNDTKDQASVVRDSIIECAVALGYPVIEKTLTVSEVEGSEVAFFSNETYVMSLINQVDHYQFTHDWKETMALDLLLMFQQQATNEDFWNHSII